MHLSIDEGYDPRKTKAHLAYEVEDLNKVTKVLMAKGYSVVPDKAFLGLIRSNVRDPFGNRIELLQAVK